MRSRLRIIEVAYSMDLTMLETARRELGITEADTSADAWISTLIRQASNMVSSYCNRMFGEETVEETFWPDNPYECFDAIVLDRTPVTAIASVLIDDTELGTSEYDLDERKGMLYRPAGTWWSWRLFTSLVVTYTGGYALLDDLPEDIERAVLMLVKGQYLSAGRNQDLRSENVPGVYSWASGSADSSGINSPEIATILAPYRRFSV